MPESGKDHTEIPSFLADAYKLISDEYTSLLHLYKQYRQLFGHSKERITLLNETAPSFFCEIQICMFDSVLLRINKLLEPAKKGSNKGVTLHWLEVLIANGDARGKNLVERLRTLRLDLKDRAVNIKSNRDKRIVHPDRSQARNRLFYPFDVSRKEVKDILADMGRYLKLVEHHYTGSDIRFDISTDGDAETLLHILADGLCYDELRDEDAFGYSGEPDNKWRLQIGDRIQEMDDLEEWDTHLTEDNDLLS